MIDLDEINMADGWQVRKESPSRIFGGITPVTQTMRQ